MLSNVKSPLRTHVECSLHLKTMSSPFCACVWFVYIFCFEPQYICYMKFGLLVFPVFVKFEHNLNRSVSLFMFIIQCINIQRPNASNIQRNETSTKAALHKQFQRWRSLKDLLNLNTDKELAEILMDNHEKIAQKNPVCLRQEFE